MVRPPKPSCLKRQHCSIPDSIPENDKFPKNYLFQFLFLTCLSLMGLDSFKSLDGCRCQDIVLFQSSLSLLASASLHTHTPLSLYAPRFILTTEHRSTDSRRVTHCVCVCVFCVPFTSEELIKNFKVKFIFMIL